MPKLLLVEDDQELASRIRESLEANNYMVEVVGSGEDAIQLLNSFPFDVIILDWTLSDITGLDVCRTFRKSGGTTPILFLTGHSEIQYKELGLDAGADDYLTKPFHERELLARLRVLLRRPFGFVAQQLKIDGLELDVEARILKDGDVEVRLTPRETSVLEFLMKHPNRTYSAKVLLDNAWPLKSNAYEETVRTCMKTLRHKLAKINRPDFVKTVLGSGYLIETTDATVPANDVS